MRLQKIYYNIPPEIKAMAGQMMIMASVIIFSISVELIQNIGILRKNLLLSLS